MNPRVTKVIPQDDYSLLLEFTNGEVKKYEVRPLLTRGIFQRLQDLSLFRQARVVLGTVEWPGDIDICPDTLYEDAHLIRAQEAAQGS